MCKNESDQGSLPGGQSASPVEVSGPAAEQYLAIRRNAADVRLTKIVQREQKAVGVGFIVAVAAMVGIKAADKLIADGDCAATTMIENREDEAKIRKLVSDSLGK